MIWIRPVAISKDSMNNIASYNLANSFYESGLKAEAINEYKSSILKSRNKKGSKHYPLTNHFINFNVKPT